MRLSQVWPLYPIREKFWYNVFGMHQSESFLDSSRPISELCWIPNREDSADETQQMDHHEAQDLQPDRDHLRIVSSEHGGMWQIVEKTSTHFFSKSV